VKQAETELRHLEEQIRVALLALAQAELDLTVLPREVSQS
jgi:hypothetical protein